MSRRRQNVETLDSKTDHTEIHKRSGIVDENDSYMEQQFGIIQNSFPWKTVFFIIFFLMAGVTCLAFAILMSFGYIGPSQDRMGPLMILGILMFIPGGYYGYILISICCKRKGFSIEDIPML